MSYLGEARVFITNEGLNSRSNLSPNLLKNKQIWNNSMTNGCKKLLNVVASAGIALCASGCATAEAEKVTKTQPNVVLLFVDDLGWGDINYTTPKDLIPNIERLSQESMTFTDAYAAAPTCSPSRASVVTGKHPARLGVVRHIKHSNTEYHVVPTDPAQLQSRNWLPDNTTTYAHGIKPFGYKTMFIGKWHLGNEKYYPIHFGFDEQKDVTDFGSPRSYYLPYFRGKKLKEFNNLPKDKYLTDHLTGDAVAYIKDQDGKKPFQLTLFYYGVHSPYVGRKDLMKKIQKQYPKYEGKSLERVAMIAAIDESVGQIRQTLKQRGLADNTMLLFVGGQGGPMANDPLRGGKKTGALYEGGGRIPFLVHWKHVIKPGTNAQPVSTVDIFPTIVEAVGGKVSEELVLDGESLMPVMTENAKLDRKEIILYCSYVDQYAYIRSGDWKMIAYRSGIMELFNLKDDLSEKVELSAQKPEIVQGLKARLFAWEKKMNVDKVSG